VREGGPVFVGGVDVGVEGHFVEVREEAVVPEEGEKRGRKGREVGEGGRGGKSVICDMTRHVPFERTPHAHSNTHFTLTMHVLYTHCNHTPLDTQPPSTTLYSATQYTKYSPPYVYVQKCRAVLFL
jgi:hypothetical protein